MPKLIISWSYGNSGGYFLSNSIIIETLDESKLEQGTKVFGKAMKFSDEMIDGVFVAAKMFYDKQHFHPICARLGKDEPIVGFGSIVLNNDTARIPYVGIENKYQGKGIGKELMLSLINYAKDFGRETVELCASKAGFPLYERLGFEYDLNTTYLVFKNIKASPNQKLIITQHTNSLPDWVYDYDRQIMGYDRSDIFPIHRNEHITLISKDGEGYGIMYGNTIGPILADSPELAQDIVLTAASIEADGMILVEHPGEKSIIHEVVDLELYPGTEGFAETKHMIYGSPLKRSNEKIYGFRSMAFG